MNVAAIILARGGSKGVPRKNVRDLAGKPMLTYTLDAAHRATGLSGIFVSTDDEEIVAISMAWNAEVIRRPEELARDETPSIDALKHAIPFMELKLGKLDFVVLLNACTPFISSRDIDTALSLIDQGTDSVVSLVEDFSSHPSKLCTLDVESFNTVMPLFGAFFPGDRHTQQKIYKRNTALYIASRDLIMEGKLFGPGLRGYVMPKDRSWDVNDEYDFKICSLLMEYKSMSN